jgi:hypothetical protein
MGWFYLHNNDNNLPPYTGKVLDHHPFHWGPGVSDPVQRAKLAPYLKALKTLTDTGLTAATVLAQCHQRWVIPLMERALPIYGMAEGAEPDALAWSPLLAEPLPPIYMAQRARRAVETKKMLCDPDEVLWSHRMLPDDRFIELVRDFYQSH